MKQTLRLDIKDSVGRYCDHVIGWLDDLNFPYNVSDASAPKGDNVLVVEEDLRYYFNYCPNCGKEIPWLE